MTGRRRTTLFDVRTPGALVVFLPMLAVGFALAVVVAFAFAGSHRTPSASLMAKYVEYGLPITGVNVVIAIGLASFTSSRVVVGVLIAWNAIVSHILINIHVLGGARKLIDVAAAEHFLPRESGNDDGDDVDDDRGRRPARLGRGSSWPPAAGGRTAWTPRSPREDT